MDTVAALVDQLLSRVGDLWAVAFIGQVFVMICEAAKPKPTEGETHREPTGFALWVTIFSFVTPLLLFVHAFMTGSGALLAIIVLIAGAMIGAGLVGWTIAALAPDVARTLNRAAAPLALLIFALTVYVTWEAVFALVKGFAGAV